MTTQHDNDIVATYMKIAGPLSLVLPVPPTVANAVRRLMQEEVDMVREKIETVSNYEKTKGRDNKGSGGG